MLGECDAWFSRAAAVDASSPEPLQGLANVKLQGGDTEGARELMTRSLELWAPDCLAEESTAATGAGAAGSSETAMQSDEGAGAAAAGAAAGVTFGASGGLVASAAANAAACGS